MGVRSKKLVLFAVLFVIAFPMGAEIVNEEFEGHDLTRYSRTFHEPADQFYFRKHGGCRDGRYFENGWEVSYKHCKSKPIPGSYNYYYGFVYYKIRTYNGENNPEWVELFEKTEDERWSSWEADTITRRVLCPVKIENQGADTTWAFEDVNFYIYHHGIEPNPVFPVAEARGFVSYRGYSYYFYAASYPDSMHESLVEETVGSIIPLFEDFIEELPRHYKAFFPLWRPGNINEYDYLMHNRPFWIHPSDSISASPFVDYHADMTNLAKLTRLFKSLPFPYFVLTTCVCDVSGQEGQVSYRYNHVRYPEVNNGDTLTGEVTVFWWPEPSDTTSPAAERAPWEIPVQERPRFVSMVDAERYEATSQLPTTDTFKSQHAMVRVSKIINIYSHERGHTNRDYFLTDVFFALDGIMYQICSQSYGVPRFTDSHDPWWKWFEDHWYNMNQPHPDWSRYPVSEYSIPAME
jgi:hypothetical protein